MTFEFLGYEFRELELAHKALLSPFLKRFPQPLAGFTFHTLVCWNEVFHYAWAFPEPETLLISCRVDESGARHLLQPVGEMSLALKRRLVDAVAMHPHTLRIFGVNPDFLERNADFSAHFQVREDRGGANYVYSAQELADLSGKKFQKKRNLISQAQRAYSHTVHPLTPDLVPECESLLEEIGQEDEEDPSASLEAELLGVRASLRHFAELDQQGILVRIEGKAAAFSIFEPLDAGTMVIHVEKALRRHKGLFQVVNQETARLVRDQGFEFINREEDMNDSGLRKAKLSYNPVALREAFLLCSGPKNPGDGPCERAW